MISRDVWVFLIMVLFGGAAALFFDILRAFRMTVRPNTAVVAATDILFVAAFFIVSAACVWNFNNGEFRFYEIAGIMLGGIFYFMLLSRWILKLFIAIDEIILRFARFILKILLTPPRFLYKILVVPTHRYAKRIRQRSQKAYAERIQKNRNRICNKAQKGLASIGVRAARWHNGVERRDAAAENKRGKAGNRAARKAD